MHCKYGSGLVHLRAREDEGRKQIRCSCRSNQQLSPEESSQSVNCMQHSDVLFSRGHRILQAARDASRLDLEPSDIASTLTVPSYISRHFASLGRSRGARMHVGLVIDRARAAPTSLVVLKNQVPSPVQHVCCTACQRYIQPTVHTCS
jgi:hypothetical protein